jgi:hypothetical protein
MENNNVPTRDKPKVIVHEVRVLVTLSVVQGRQATRSFMMGNDPQGMKVIHDPQAYASLHSTIEETMDRLQSQADEEFSNISLPRIPKEEELQEVAPTKSREF